MDRPARLLSTSNVLLSSPSARYILSLKCSSVLNTQTTQTIMSNKYKDRRIVFRTSKNPDATGESFFLENVANITAHKFFAYSRTLFCSTFKSIGAMLSTVSFIPVLGYIKNIHPCGLAKCNYLLPGTTSITRASIVPLSPRLSILVFLFFGVYTSKPNLN